MARPACLYCGATLPRETLAAAARAAGAAAGAAAEPTAETPMPAGDVPAAGAGSSAGPGAEPGAEARSVLVLDLAGVEPRSLAAALKLSLYEAKQRLLRGGLQLHRIAPVEEARADAERLAALGVPVLRFDEAAVRQAAAPLLAQGGRFEAGTLSLRTPKGARRVANADVLLLVRGPIRREYRTREDWKRLKSATLADGYRFQLHLRGDEQPLELDPGSFEFDAREPLATSSMLRLSEWFVELAAGRPVDDAFRLLPPALGPAEPDASKRLGSAGALGGRPAADPAEAPILDNVRQFRFHSAWRGLVERRRARS
ncbi:MAG: hypothetical protein AB7Q30_04880 [Vicinamibacteria bacterium]